MTRLHADPPLISAYSFARGCGLTSVTVWKEGADLKMSWEPATVTLTPGAQSKIRQRVWLAVLDRNRARTGDENFRLDEAWTLRVGTAAVLAPVGNRSAA